MREGERGAGLASLLAALAVLALAIGASLPAVGRAVRDNRIRASAREMVSALRAARHRAIAESGTRGLVFRPEGEDWSYTLHADGDGDGLRSSDVRRGVDAPLGPPRRLSDRHPTVRPGFLPRERIRRVPPARGFLRDLEDPVRFGNSDLISFSPTGRASSGTLYLTDGQTGQWAIVLYGVTGRIRVYRYDPERERWRR
jgi:Tfp pilus assembly protein FimT